MTPNQTLYGKTIVVTRPLAQAQEICETLELHQANVVHFPVMQIIAADDLSVATQFFKNIQKYRIIIFTSSNAVQYAAELAKDLNITFHSAILAAIGPATKSELEDLGYQVKIYPVTKYTSEALLQHHDLQNLVDQDILIIKGQGGREILLQELRARGAKVGQAIVYQRTLPENRNPIDLTSLTQQDTAILIYSAEAAQNLWSMCSKSEQAWISNVTFIMGSERIAETTISVEVAKKTIIAENPSDDAMFNAVINWASKH